MASAVCAHLSAIKKVVHPKALECEDCVPIGLRTWMHLRTCQTCGGTRCCDSSPNKHASKHARKQPPSRDRLRPAGRALAVLLPRRRDGRVLAHPATLDRRDTLAADLEGGGPWPTRARRGVSSSSRR